MSRRRSFTHFFSSLALARNTPHSMAAEIVHRFLLLFALVGGFAGCSRSVVSLSQGPRDYSPTDYERVLALWTRSEDLVTLSALDDILTVGATFEAWDFRWAYSVRYANDYQLSAEQSRAMVDAALVDATEHHQFFVALYGSSNRRWNELNTSHSAWTVRLIDDKGNETGPEAIVAIAKPGAVERTYFPYASVWRKAFRIKFPVSTPTGPTIASDASFVGLRFSGALGSVELHWTLVR
jgi:hypothetical protein